MRRLADAAFAALVLTLVALAVALLVACGSTARVATVASTTTTATTATTTTEPKPTTTIPATDSAVEAWRAQYRPVLDRLPAHRAAMDTALDPYNLVGAYQAANALLIDYSTLAATIPADGTLGGRLKAAYGSCADLYQAIVAALPRASETTVGQIRALADECDTGPEA